MTNESDHSVNEPSIPAETTQMNSTDTGVGMISLGGAMILLVYVVFELIARDYFTSFAALSVALVAVVLPKADRAKVERLAPFLPLMAAVGYVLAAMGVFEILDDLRFDGYDDGFWDVVAALIAYAGYALAFMGAKAISE